jgi:hypothetical protein
MLAKHIGDYLSQDSGTSRLVPQVAVLRALRQRLAGALPDNLRRSCSIANYKLGIVVLLADNSAVAAKLRQLEPRLLEHLGASGRKVTGIKVQVQGRTSFGAQVTEEKALSLPPRAGEALAELGAKLPDTPLKAAVEKLAKKARPGR